MSVAAASLMDDKLAERFHDLFLGSQGAHGQTNVQGRKRGGKQAASYNLVREPLTVDLVQKHLKLEYLYQF